MRLQNHLDDLGHRHQPDDLDHPDDLGHRHQPDDLRHPDVVRLGDPFPELMRTDCYPDVRLDEEFPCPAPKRMGCYPDEGFLGLLEPELPELKRQELQVHLVLPLPLEPLLIRPEPEQLGPQPLVQLAQPEPEPPEQKPLPQTHRR